MEHELSVGDGIRFRLAWDEPPIGEYASHQTASGELKIELEPAPPENRWPDVLGARLSGSRPVLVEAYALDAFAEQLASLLKDLTGSATLEPVTGLGEYGDFEITITLDHGKGAVSGFLAGHYHAWRLNHTARLTFDGLEIDQTYLEATRQQLHALLTAR